MIRQNQKVKIVKKNIDTREWEDGREGKETQRKQKQKKQQQNNNKNRYQTKLGE